MTLDDLIQKLQDLKEFHGGGIVEVEIVPTDGRATGNDTRSFTLDGVSQNLTGGATLTIYDPDWKPEAART